MEDRKYVVDANIKINVIHGHKNLTHLMRQPTIDDIYLVETITKAPIIVRRNNDIESKESDNQKSIHVWDKCVIETEGYGVNKDIKGWKNKVPMMHRIFAGKEMRECNSIPPIEVEEDYGPESIQDIDLDHQVVYVNTKQLGEWMLTSHIFRQPDEKDLSRYDRIQAMAKTKLGKNKVKVNTPSTCKPWVELYDCLIANVIGYSKMKESAIDIKTLVPVLHKIEAVKSLFDAQHGQVSQNEKN
jgi:hypothetical protein